MTVAVERIWVGLGLFGQLLFSARFIIQWIASERQKRSVIPVAFWYFSLGGSALLLAYAIYRKDPVFILGQSAGAVVYVRNLWLIKAARHLEAVHQQLSAFTENPDPNMIYWIELQQDREVLAVHAAPLNVGPLLEEYIWEPKRVVVLTSATLRTNASFDYIRDRLSAYDVKEAVIGSPFDYERATLVYVPTDMPDPSQRDEYQRYVERGLIELAAATNGRLLALFTSYAQLRQTAQAIAPRLALGNITVFDQSDGTSRQMLVEGFKKAERAVLLGTRSFWEGVDIPGDDLSALVIVRLPFAVPSDPIFAARSEQYENSFMQYAVPDAILRFRQGFGRLIRTQTDRGVVALFDNRVITKRYGQAFLDSLPACTVRRGPLADLPGIAAQWIDGERA